MKMETNRYDYNTTVQWTPQQNQFYEGGNFTPQARQQQLPRPQNPRAPQHAARQQPKAPEQQPKAGALALAAPFKRQPGVASIAGSGTISGRAAPHLGGA